MPITPATKPTQPGRKKISLPLLLDQLDREWAEAQQADSSFRTDDEHALQAYYHTALRVALHWIDGDYHYTFPAWYADQRLARLCSYLKGLEGQAFNPLMDARDKQVELLRTVTWPAYRDRCTDTMNYTGTGGLPQEIQSYTWDGIDTLHGPEQDDGPLDKPLPYLPRFACPESEAFHCNALAVMFLNRATKNPLVDLDVTPF